MNIDIPSILFQKDCFWWINIFFLIPQPKNCRMYNWVWSIIWTFHKKMLHKKWVIGFNLQFLENITDIKSPNNRYLIMKIFKICDCWYELPWHYVFNITWFIIDILRKYWMIFLSCMSISNLKLYHCRIMQRSHKCNTMFSYTLSFIYNRNI
jgi:hypothetical protein